MAAICIYCMEEIEDTDSHECLGNYVDVYQIQFGNVSIVVSDKEELTKIIDELVENNESFIVEFKQMEVDEC